MSCDKYCRDISHLPWCMFLHVLALSSDIVQRDRVLVCAEFWSSIEG